MDFERVYLTICLFSGRSDDQQQLILATASLPPSLSPVLSVQPIEGIKNGNYYLVTEVGGSSDVDSDHVLHNAQVQLQERKHS